MSFTGLFGIVGIRRIRRAWRDNTAWSIADFATTNWDMPLSRQYYRRRFLGNGCAKEKQRNKRNKILLARLREAYATRISCDPTSRVRHI